MKIKYFTILILFLISCSYYPELENESEIKVIDTLKYLKLDSGTKESRGLIIYPGGLVDAYAYMDLAVLLSKQNLGVFIAKFPSNLAVLDINIAQGIRNEYTTIEEWSIMGNYLGGAMACSEVDNNKELYKNLILLGAYPAKSVDLTNFDGAVLSIYAENDGFTSEEDIETSRSQFLNSKEVFNESELESPEAGAYFYKVIGGNHSNFASYGLQKGDGSSSITRIEQQNIVSVLSNKLLE